MSRRAWLRRGGTTPRVQFVSWIFCARYDEASLLPGTIRRICRCGTAIVCVPSIHRLICSGKFEGLCPSCSAEQRQEFDGPIIEVSLPAAELEYAAIVGRN